MKNGLNVPRIANSDVFKAALQMPLSGVEHGVTGISQIPLIGTPFAVGWEAGKLYGPSKWGIFY